MISVLSPIVVALIHPVFRHIIPICSENSYEDTMFVIPFAHFDVTDQLLATFTTFEIEWGEEGLNETGYQQFVHFKRVKDSLGKGEPYNSPKRINEFSRYTY